MNMHANTYKEQKVRYNNNMTILLKIIIKMSGKQITVKKTERRLLTELTNL